MDKKTRKIIKIVCGIAVLLMLTFTVVTFNMEINKKRLPELGLIHNFNLIDENGEPFGLKDLYGRVWIADFFFTTCGDICPIMTKNMASLNRSYKLVQNMRLVSISVNPEFDQPNILRDYIEKNDLDTTNWHFLTGSREEISKLAKESFKLGKIDEPVFHSAYFTLVDRKGYIRGYYDGTDQEAVNKLFKDAAKILRER